MQAPKVLRAAIRARVFDHPVCLGKQELCPTHNSGNEMHDEKQTLSQEAYKKCSKVSFYLSIRVKIM